MTHHELEILYIEDNAADVEWTLVALRRHKMNEPNSGCTRRRGSPGFPLLSEGLRYP